MKSLIVMILLLLPLNVSAACKKTKPCGVPWEQCQFLWKPVAEHVGLPVVVTLPRSDIPKVFLLNRKRKIFRELSLRSIGDAGVAHQEYARDAGAIARKYKSIFVRVRRNNSCFDYRIRNPRKRSDGKAGEGNYNA